MKKSNMLDRVWSQDSGGTMGEPKEETLNPTLYATHFSCAFSKTDLHKMS